MEGVYSLSSGTALLIFCMKTIAMIYGYTRKRKLSGCEHSSEGDSTYDTIDSYYFTKNDAGFLTLAKVLICCTTGNGQT